MVDETLILRKLADLDQYFGQISEYEKITVDQYKGDWKLQRIVERTLQMMIETCVDIAGHIIADSKFKIPDSYADTFRVLSENDIIPKDLCRTMIQISKFRNIIVLITIMLMLKLSLESLVKGWQISTHIKTQLSPG